MEALYKFTLRTQSALFMHSESGRQQAELRVSSIRGAMRYWFRAMLASSCSPQRLHDLEGQCFGDRLYGTRLQMRSCKETSRLRALKLPHKGREAAEAFEAGTELWIEFSQTPAVFDPQCFSAALWSFWLALSLGGFGARARRGAGSVSLQLIEPELEGMPLGVFFRDTTELKDYLQEGLRGARGAFNELQLEAEVNPDSRTRQLPHLSVSEDPSRIVVIEVGDPKESEHSIRERIMLQLRQVKNPVFGLPLKLDGEWVKQFSSAGKVRSKARHASPLWIHLNQTEQCWAAVLTVLRPLPSAEKLDVVKISEFIDLFKHDKKEVSIPI